MSALDAWPALTHLCELLPRVPDACAFQLHGWLRRHINGIRDVPSVETVTRLRDALRFAQRTLPRRLVDELEFVLRTVR